MDFVLHPKPKADRERLRQLKIWVYDLLELDIETSVSINQLQCAELGCPPVETVIVVLTSPVQQYKIHKPLAEIAYADLMQVLSLEERSQ